MSQEKLLQDFSGGMNALAAVDKLDPKECLLAENIRFDETGNIQSAGAFTHQNTATYAASSGTAVNNVHSLFWNPAIGGVAGVGQDVFTGPTLGGMARALTAQNTMQQKMSFASAPNRVYFDVGSVGYWTDMTNLLLVDWVPPSGIGSTITGPTIVGTCSQTGAGVAWTNPNNLTSTSSLVTANVVFSTATGTSSYSESLRATMSTNSFAISTVAVTGIALTLVVQYSVVGIFPQAQISLMKNGVPTGNTKILQVTNGGVFTTYTFGGSNDLWGASWAQADINSGGFGFQFFIGPTSGYALTAKVYQGQLTIYQGAGFVAAAAAGGILSGTYTWKITFVAANGEESDAGVQSNSVSLSGQQGTLTAIQIGDARTVARNIYRKGGGLTSYYLVGTIQDNLATTYLDNFDDLSAVTQGIILAGDVPGDSPNTRLGNTSVRFPTLHYDRIFWVNQNKKNQIIWSKPLNGFAYPAVNFINVGDSSPVTRTISIFGELIIFKANSQIWRLTGTDESSFDLSQTPSAASTDESFSITALPDKILFHNRYGFWVFNGYTSQTMTPKLDLWMKQEDRTGKSLFGVNGFHPPETVSTTVPLNFDSTGNSEKYYLAYAEAGQTQNNAMLVFDVKHGNITKREPGTPLPLSLAIDPSNGYVYMGDNLGFISLMDDWNGTNGAGANINFDFQHGYQDFQRGSNKALWVLEFFLNTNNQSLTPTVYYDGGASSETLTAISTTSLQRVVRTLEATASRKMQNFSWRLNGSLSKVNVSGTPQIQIVHVKAVWDIRAGRARTGQ